MHVSEACQTVSEMQSAALTLSVSKTTADCGACLGYVNDLPDSYDTSAAMRTYSMTNHTSPVKMCHT